MFRPASIVVLVLATCFAGQTGSAFAQNAGKVKAKKAKVTKAKAAKTAAKSRSGKVVSARRRTTPAANSNQRLLSGISSRSARRQAQETSRKRDSANGTKASAARAKTRLLEAGISPIRIDGAMHHIELGMPSDASTKSPEDFLLARNQYIASYSKSKKVPNWVSWRITAGDIAKQTGVRAGDFRPDRTLPAGWKRASKMDYKRSGYTRGHMVASSERQGSTRGNSKTFVYTNMLPQIAENNGGPWLHLENHYRNQVIDHKMDVYVMAGGIYKGAKVTIGRNEVAVPSATWKIAVLVKKGTGLSGIDASTRVVSVIVPNEVGKVQMSQSFTDFRVSPRAIEKQTGLSFFTHLPKEIRKALLTKIDTEVVVKKKKAKKKWQ